MATFQKFVPAASGATHVAADASIVDILMPHVELVGSTANFLRSGVYALGGWVGRGYRDTKSFGL